LGGATIYTAGLALLADVYPHERREAAMGAALSATATGTLLGPVVGGALYEWGGYRLPFLAAAIIVIANLVLVFRLSEPIRPTPRKRQALFALAFHPELRGVLTAVVVGSTLLSLLEPTLPGDLRLRLESGPASVGLLFGVGTIAFGAAAPVVGLLSNRWGRRTTMGVGVLAAAPTLVLVALPTSWIVQALLMIPFGAACSLLLTPTLPELADNADRVGEAAYGNTYALFNLAYGAGMIIGPVVGGGLAERIGLPAALSSFAGAALFLVPVVLHRPTATEQIGTRPSSLDAAA
jgi:MFS family permease